MSATTLKLPYTRFVAQVSSAPARSKSTYLALMEENLAALQEFPWHAAAEVPVSLTDHDFTASTYLSDAYDAYKMTGNYDASAMTEIAYAGMVAYRFKIPDSARVSGSEVPITSVSLPISRDRFLKGGVRVAVLASNVTAPHTSWNAVRGDSGGAVVATVRAALAQSAANLLASTAAAGTLEIDLSALPENKQKSTYLWVYISLEDYTDHWDMYSANEQRLYAIEGSAMLVAGSAEFTFADTVTADAASSPTRLITTGYPDSSTINTSGNSYESGLRAHRVFAAGDSSWVAFIGGEKGGAIFPALRIFHTYSSTSSKVSFELDSAYLIDEQTGTAEKDIVADWYDTSPGKALMRGVGVTGVFVAPEYDSADIVPPSGEGHKYSTIYVSTREGIYTLGGIDISRDSVNFLPQIRRWGNGGDILLVTKVADVENVYDSNVLYQYHAECASIENGKIVVGDRELPFAGRATGLGTYKGNDSGRFLVAGDFTSVGGVPCSHVALIDARNDTLTVTPLSIDSLLVPNVWDNFRVVFAGTSYYALGDFTSLNGVTCAHGAAIVTEPSQSNTSGITAQSQYITDVVHVSTSGFVKIKADRQEIAIV